jgi:hypothetical protein
MGLKSSPYQAAQAILVAKEVILGDRSDTTNVFRWDDVRLNLPGYPDYGPALPWVSKVRLEDGKIAADLFTYVDDVRVTGNLARECDAATRRAASTVNGLGVQDAPRKRRFGEQEAGAWAGSVVETDGQGVYVTVSQETWDKSKRYIGNIVEELSRTSQLNHKELEKKRGFLINVTHTYPEMVPYLKGIHQTLETLRPNRDKVGWKNKAPMVKNPLVAEAHAAGPPKFVKAAPRLAGDLEALQHLTSLVLPPRRRVRSATTPEVYYGFGDASAMGFILDMEVKSDLFYRHGHWCDATAEASSNYREVKKLVDGLEDLVRSGRVKDAKVFLFTDNSTAEAVFYHGNSTSRTLFELMLRLRKVEMDGGFNLRVIHVAGTRMIEQGTDGGSRGDLTQGVLNETCSFDLLTVAL